MDEFVVRTASASTKKLSLLKFHKNDKFVWNDVRVRKEGDHHPWQLKMRSGNSSRRFKAVREGGVSDNASYFVFFKLPDQNTFEVCPINDWYNVSATQRYKALSAEEAEKKFEERHKMLNLFSVMRSKNKETSEEGEGTGSFKISERDEWDEGGMDDDDHSGDDDEKRATDKKRKNNKNKKDDPDKSDKFDEAVEESDEGDFEREVDYMSDTSSSSSSNNDEGQDIKSISEEAALKDLLQSASEDEDEIKKEDEGDNSPADPSEHQQVKQEPNPDVDMLDSSSDSDVSDIDEKINSIVFMKKLDPPTTTAVTETKPTLKRKISGTETAGTSKRPCTTDSGQEIENLVRRYLMRKPMTTKALLKQLKAKLKGSGINQTELEVVKMAEIIRKINPERLMVNNELLLFIRSGT